jgi:nucleoside-triphosphatase
MSDALRVLLEGRPGVGKTTVARRLVERLLIARIPVTGFTSEELRRGSHRVGFAVEAIGGRRAVMAHVDIAGPPRVGKYGVDLEAFENVALPSVSASSRAVVIDELGKMELASAAFRGAVDDLLDGKVSIVATVHAFRHPYTDGLKGRSDIDVIRVTARNRDSLPEQLARRMGRFVRPTGAGRSTGSSS